ncbi:unnamed protein product, partial [Symbiodinium sp. KB8]
VAGRVQFSDAQVMGRAGKLALSELRAASMRHANRPVLVFTDGASETSGHTVGGTGCVDASVVSTVKAHHRCTCPLSGVTLRATSGSIVVGHTAARKEELSETVDSFLQLRIKQALPITISSVSLRTSFIFTDGAFEKGEINQQALSCMLKTSVHPIYELELLPVLIAMQVWGNRCSTQFKKFGVAFNLQLNFEVRSETCWESMCNLGVQAKREEGLHCLKVVQASLDMRVARASVVFVVGVVALVVPSLSFLPGGSRPTAADRTSMGSAFSAASIFETYRPQESENGWQICRPLALWIVSIVATTGISVPMYTVGDFVLTEGSFGYDTQVSDPGISQLQRWRHAARLTKHDVGLGLSAGGRALIYQLPGQDAVSDVGLQRAKAVEDSLRSLGGWQRLCGEMPASYQGLCREGDSLVSASFAMRAQAATSFKVPRISGLMVPKGVSSQAQPTIIKRIASQ